MKIVCATLNSKFIHSSLAPWCLKSGIEAFCKSSYEIVVVESTVNSSLTEFCDRIISFSPDIIAFSCYIWNVDLIFEACRIIKTTVDCKICLGGPEAAYRTGEVLNTCKQADFVLTGEGEWCFSSLIDALDKGENIDSVKGISFLRNGELVSVDEQIITESPPSPYCQEYFDSLNGRIAYIEASRGCPYRCSYCLSGRLGGFRIFDFDRICNDIVRLSHSGTKTIKFIDRTFNANKDYANRILTFIKENYGRTIKEGVCFHFEISADILSEDTLDILKSLPEGICQLEIGIQSFNEDTLNSINRRSDLNKLCQNIRTLVSFNNIHIHIDLIAGLPYENIESYISGFNQAFLLNAHMLQAGFLKVLHGSDLRKDCSSFGCVYKSLPPYEVMSTNHLSECDLQELKYCEKGLDRLYNSGRFLLTIDYLLNALNFSAYELMNEAGKLIFDDGISLAEITAKLYTFYSEKCDCNILKEKILSDIALSGANIKIPDMLQTYDKRYRYIKKKLTEKLKSNIKIVILYSENKVLAVIQNGKNDLRGRKEYHIFDIDEVVS